jgi:hypothetical protein
MPTGMGVRRRMTQLQRLIITFKPEELIIHALYRSQDGPNPGTQARGKEVSELTREGLREALRALEGRVDVVGTSGYSVREDIMVAEVRLGQAKPDKESAA